LEILSTAASSLFCGLHNFSFHYLFTAYPQVFPNPNFLCPAFP